MMENDEHRRKSPTVVDLHSEQRPAEQGRADVERMFPEATPQTIEAAYPQAEWKRYLLPLFLVALAAVVAGFMYLDESRETTVAEVSTNEPTETIAAQDRVSEAESIVEEADKLYTEGFTGWNDHAVLGKARAMYREAWRLLTDSDWDPALATATDVKLPKVIHDSPRARILRDDAFHKLKTLEAELNGWSWW